MSSATDSRSSLVFQNTASIWIHQLNMAGELERYCVSVEEESRTDLKSGVFVACACHVNTSRNAFLCVVGDRYKGRSMLLAQGGETECSCISFLLLYANKKNVLEIMV